jgi:hypothetical protein
MKSWKERGFVRDSEDEEDHTSEDGQQTKPFEVQFSKSAVTAASKNRESKTENGVVCKATYLRTAEGPQSNERPDTVSENNI